DLAHAGRNVQDLQTAFTIAGAPTLVGSLWPIESLAAKELVTRFFKEWRSAEENGASVALARATRAYLDASDAAHQHPWYWAPFVVAGNGAVSGSGESLGRKAMSTFTAIEDFAAGGEIYQAVKFKSDLVLSMIAEWDGEKFHGIISRREVG